MIIFYLLLSVFSSEGEAAIPMTDRRFINQHQYDQEGSRLLVDCRFCHYQQQHDRYKHIAPCQCQVDTKYVHRNCLERWIIQKFQHVYNYSDNGDARLFNVGCQFCHCKIEMQFEIIRKWRNYSQFLERIQESKILFVFLICTIVVSISALIFILIYGISQGSDTLSTQNDKVIGLSVGLGLSSLFLIIALIYFLLVFAIIKSINITSFAQPQEKHLSNSKYNSNKIVYQKPDQIEKSNLSKKNSKKSGIKREQVSGIKKEQVSGLKKEKVSGINKQSLMIKKKQSSINSQPDEKELPNIFQQKQSSKTLSDYVMQEMYEHDKENSKRNNSRKHQELDEKQQKQNKMEVESNVQPEVKMMLKNKSESIKIRFVN